MSAQPRESSDVLLDRATAAREVGIVVAFALMAAKGDPDNALTILDEFAGVSDEEAAHGVLDAAGIAAQAVRDAVEMKGATNG